jgi:hypothetical protein
MRVAAALCCLLALLPAAPARAQGAGAEVEPAPRKFDEYVNLFTSCNAGAHLDGFAIELHSRPDVNGHIIIYGPGGAGDSFGRLGADATKNYLVQTRGVDESRLSVVYGGRNTNGFEVLTELWLVPEGAEPPAAARREDGAAKFEGKFATVGLWENLGSADYEGWSSSLEVALVGLSDMLRQRPELRAYLVAFHDAQSMPGAWRRVGSETSELLSRYGVEASRVEVIFAGYRKESRLELWALPRRRRPPAAAARERRPEASVQLGAFHQYELKQDGAARRAFKGVAEVLKADGELSAYVVVRLPFAGPRAVDEEEAGQAGAEATDAVAAADPEEPPDINLALLAERWKADLRKEYGIGEQRLVLIFVPSREEWNADLLETWIVPRGAAPPDPFAGPEAEEVQPEEL